MPVSYQEGFHVSLAGVHGASWPSASTRSPAAPWVGHPRTAPTALRPTGRPVETIEELTGRKVLALLSQAHVEPDITMEIFFVDGPLEGFGALELVEPE